MDRSEAVHRAEQHVKRVRDFFYHLMTYVFVCALLVIMDLQVETGGNAVLGLDWAYWVILAWGIGVMGHAISVFVGKKKVEELAQEYLEQELVHH